MMSPEPVHLFSTWSNRPQPYDENPKKIQEVIFYCASRLRAAVTATANAAAIARVWMEPNLTQELVGVF